MKSTIQPLTLHAVREFKPRSITSEVKSRLLEAFKDGHTDTEACLIANVPARTFYSYCDKCPDFRDLTEILRHTPALKARRNVNLAINAGDLHISQWYLERKLKNEFSLRAEITGASGQDRIVFVDE